MAAEINKENLENVLTQLSMTATDLAMRAGRTRDQITRVRYDNKADGIAHSIALLSDYFELEVGGDWNQIGQRGMVVHI